MLLDDEEGGQALWAPISEGMINDEIINQRVGARIQRSPIQEVGSTSQSAQPIASSIPSSSTTTNSHTRLTEQTQPSPPTKTHDSVTEAIGADVTEMPMGRGHRHKKPPVTLQNYVVNSVQLKSAEPKVVYPVLNNDDVHRFSERHIAYVTTIITTTEPKSFREAMKDK